MKELTQPNKRGPKPRLVTVKLLKEIERLAARGLSQKQLCHALGFSASWWFDQKQKTQELQEAYQKGSTQGILEIADSLFEAARAGIQLHNFFILNAEALKNGRIIRIRTTSR